MRLSVVALACLFAASAANAQTSKKDLPGYKDPTISTLLSVIVPGGGQLYSGETTKGATLLAVGYGGFGLLTLAPNNGVKALGLGAYLGSVIYGIVDASSAADRHNATLRHVAALPVRPTIVAGASQSVKVGLSVSFGGR